MRELERRFSPEFRNRIDEVVLFRPLSKDEVREIAVQQIGKIQEALARSERRTDGVSPEALEQLVQDGYSLAYGARFLKRVIEDRIKLPISQRWTEGDALRRRRRGTARSRSRSRERRADIGSRQPPECGLNPRRRSPAPESRATRRQRDYGSGCAAIDVARRPTS